MNLDKIFQKSNLDENKKKSKTIFGKLLIKLRSENLIKLYSLLGAVSDTDLKDNILEIALDDKTSYDMVNNQHDIANINNLLETIESGVKVAFINNGKEVFDQFKFESFLKQEFGKILTIK